MALAILLFVLACGTGDAPAEPNSIFVPELVSEYTSAGAEMAARRDPDKTWEDGSNWHDGQSQEPPAVPLAPGSRILDGMTCAQWEALEMASFPEGYTLRNWDLNPDADKIADLWRANMADVVWGAAPEADEWLERENFMDSCGRKIR